MHQAKKVRLLVLRLFPLCTVTFNGTEFAHMYLNTHNVKKEIDMRSFVNKESDWMTIDDNLKDNSNCVKWITFNTFHF